jgi:hypothetical protein
MKSWLHNLLWELWLVLPDGWLADRVEDLRYSDFFEDIWGGRHDD